MSGSPPEIRVDEPDRSTELINAARDAPTAHRFSIKWLMAAMLVMSCSLAALRAGGILERWEDYFLLMFGLIALFAPLIAFTACGWWWRGRPGFLLPSAIAAVGTGLAFLSTLMLMEVIRLRDLFGIVVVFGVMWMLQIAAILFVRFAVFQQSGPQRVLPEKLK